MLVESLLALSINAHTVIDRSALWCLKENVYHEARGEEEFGQFLAGGSVLRRANGDESKICKVVFKPHQYSWTSDKKLRNAPRNPKQYKKAEKVAKALITYSRLYGVDALPTHYHRYDISTKWSKGKEKVRIGDHVFMWLAEFKSH